MSQELGSGLVAFRARNARSFQRDCQLTMEATALSNPGVARPIPLVRHKEVRVLPAVGVFGANASGKSNVLRIIHDMRQFVLSSFRRGNPTGGVARLPFRGGDPTDPTVFEIELVLAGVRYLYGFSIDDHRVLEEWCRHAPNGVMKPLFERLADSVELGSAESRAGRATKQILRSNALFLSTGAATRHPLLGPLYGWFQRNLILAEAETRAMRQAMTFDMLADPSLAPALLGLVRAADLGISSVIRERVPDEIQERARRAAAILMGDEPVEDLPEMLLPDLLKVTHDLDGKSVEFHLFEESLGTQVWLGLIGPVLLALRGGSVLLVDELDASLHPDLVAALVGLFTDQHTNPHRAQLIFNAHDMTLLGDSENHPLGRDQIWFTDKHESGESTLRPLADVSPRKNESLAKRYAAGMYGAKPMVAAGDFAAALTPVVERS